MQHPEDDLQMAVSQYLDLAGNVHGWVWWHTPNGGKRDSREAGRFKAMGVKAGVPDLTIIGHGGRAYFIELKVGRNTMTDDQDAFMAAVRDLDCRTGVARSVAEVQMLLREWGLI